jgi:hypothetical protein
MRSNNPIFPLLKLNKSDLALPITCLPPADYQRLNDRQ